MSNILPIEEHTLRYKSKKGERLFIRIWDNSCHGTYSLGFVAYDKNTSEAKAELYFGISDTLTMIWKMDNKELICSYLYKKGLQLLESKIESNDSQKEIIVMKSKNAPGAFPYNIISGKDIHLETSQDKYKKNYIVRKDILGYLYSKKGNWATSKEIIEYVWCYSDLLCENILFLYTNDYAYGARFTREIVEKGGDDNINTSIVSLSDEGKVRYEEMLREEPVVLSEHLKYFENWVSFASNKDIFLAHRFTESVLIAQVKDEIKKYGFNYQEGKVDDCGLITEDILDKIKRCSFFLVLITPLKEFKDGGYSTSSWLLMEIGVAIAFGRRCLILAEDKVDAEEFARKLQPDVQYETFNRTLDFPKKLNNAIERLKSEYEKNRDRNHHKEV